MRGIWICCLIGGITLVQAKSQTPAKIQLKRTCSRCHSLDVVRAQHLSRAEWEQELVKMTVMGAKIENPGALLDYLAKYYGR